MEYLMMLAPIGLGIAILIFRSNYLKNPSRGTRNWLLGCSIANVCLTAFAIITCIIITLCMLLFDGLINGLAGNELDEFVPAFSLILIPVIAMYIIPSVFSVITAVIGFRLVANKELTERADQNSAREKAMNTPYNTVNQGGFSTQQPAGWRCNSCGRINPPGAMFCGGCGTKKM